MSLSKDSIPSRKAWICGGQTDFIKFIEHELWTLPDELFSHYVFFYYISLFCVEVRGQFVWISSFLLQCGSWGMNSNPTAWQQVLVPSEPSRWLSSTTVKTWKSSLWLVFSISKATWFYIHIFLYSVQHVYYFRLRTESIFLHHTWMILSLEFSKGWHSFS